MSSTSTAVPTRTIINIGDNEESFRPQHPSWNSSETSSAEKMFQRNIMLAREDFQETASVATFTSSEADESLRRFITKISILPTTCAVDKCRPRKNISIMSVNQDPSSLCNSLMMVQTTFDGNLSDDQKLVLNISGDCVDACESKKKIELKLSNENVNRILLSGQCSPCEDHLDSGTCSDADMNQPPPLPPKISRMNFLKNHMLSDSFCSDASSASSSDSMQFAQSCLMSPDLIRSIDDRHKTDKNDQSAPLPTSLLMDIRNRAMIKDESSSDDERESNYGDLVLCNREEKILLNFYNDDKFYKFHMNEHLSLDACNLMTHDESDENFAGLKDLSNRTATIRSAKGTIRGVKNRVRNGIATFLQMQQTTVKVSCSTSIEFSLENFFRSQIRSRQSHKSFVFFIDFSIFLNRFFFSSRLRTKVFEIFFFVHFGIALSKSK